MKKGFTLAEILVVMAIVAIVGTILVAIFTATLRGSSKSQMLSVIKQNGQAVLENMDKLIRGADSVVCPPPAASIFSNTMVVVKDGTYTRFRFIPKTGSVNGTIKQDSPLPPVPPAVIDCSDTTWVNPVNTLTDTNTQTGVSVENGSFQLNSSSAFKDQVTVKFDLRPGVVAPAAIAGQIDPVTFQTTVQVRNDRK